MTIWRLRGVVATPLLAAIVVSTDTWAGSALVVRRGVSHPDALIALGSHEWERLPAVA